MDATQATNKRTMQQLSYDKEYQDILVRIRGIHHLCAVLLSEKKRTGLACRAKRILLPNWVGVFKGGGWPSIREKAEDNDSEKEDVSLNVIGDVQKIKQNKNGTENRIHFWREVARV